MRVLKYHAIEVHRPCFLRRRCVPFIEQINLQSCESDDHDSTRAGAVRANVPNPSIDGTEAVSSCGYMLYSPARTLRSNRVADGWLDCLVPSIPGSGYIGRSGLSKRRFTSQPFPQNHAAMHLIT